jgi:hypothetical protein
MRSVQPGTTILMHELYWRVQFVAEQLLLNLPIENIRQLWVLPAMFSRMLRMHNLIIHMHFLFSRHLLVRHQLHTQLPHYAHLLLSVPKPVYSMPTSLQELFIDTGRLLNVSFCCRLLEPNNSQMHKFMRGTILLSGGVGSERV